MKKILIACLLALMQTSFCMYHESVTSDQEERDHRRTQQRWEDLEAVLASAVFTCACVGFVYLMCKGYEKQDLDDSAAIITKARCIYAVFGELMSQIDDVDKLEQTIRQFRVWHRWSNQQWWMELAHIKAGLKRIERNRLYYVRNGVYDNCVPLWINLIDTLQMHFSFNGFFVQWALRV